MKTVKKEIKPMFACPSCSSRRDKDSEECSKCRSTVAAIQIYPEPTVILSKSDAKQILIAKSMTSGISRRDKSSRPDLSYDEDFILGY